MTTRLVHMAWVSCGLLLASCKMPFFAEDVRRIDWNGPPVQGTIAVSQPKMYRRESLINERRDEVKWLGEELDASKGMLFDPELIRETEQIKQFAAALGLSFDPAGALNYRRAAATGDIQQEIEVLKLQLQLDQLRRDAELLRSALPAQSAPVNSDLGKVASTGPAAATGAPAAAAAGKLTEAIDQIKKELATRLGADAKPATKTNASANPADLFRDRSAYRDLLKSARNAASLDDLHDYGGGALMRLNFQAMVLPEQSRLSAPGVVQMTIKRPTFTDDEKVQVYRQWLEHLNLKMNRATETGWEPDSEIVYSRAADNFDLIAFGYPPSPSALGKGNPKAVAMAPAASPCTGYAPDPTQVGPPCSALVFAVPRFNGGSLQEGAYSTLDKYIRHSTLGAEKEDIDSDRNAHALIVGHARNLIRDCGLPIAPPGAPGEPIKDERLLYLAIAQAQVRVVAADEYAQVERQAQQLLAKRRMASLPRTATSQLIAARAARARFLLKTFEQAAYSGCKEESRARFRASSPMPFIPQGFADAMGSNPRIAVYEIGPREQVQQVSTVARVANSLSLALAAAASAPGTGLGANTAASYSREAIGRAAAIERVPGLIGYATTDDTNHPEANVFGWVIAPKAVMDPKGRIVLEQTPRALDLSVELSVPGWWPTLTLETRSGWAPDAAAVTDGTFTLQKKPRSFTVPIAPNYADFDDLTGLIQHGASGVTHKAVLDEASLRNQLVAACRATSLYLRGANLWRVAAVVVGGYRLDETNITLAPDMSGVLVAVPALDELVSNTASTSDKDKAKIGFTIFTRYGDVSSEVDYVPKPVPAGCKEPETPPDADAPLIASVSPAEFKAGSEQWFRIVGTRLNKFDQVTINGQPGQLVELAKDGKSVKARFAAVQTQSLPISRTIPLSFYGGGKKLGERLVENRD